MIAASGCSQFISNNPGRLRRSILCCQAGLNKDYLYPGYYDKKFLPEKGNKGSFSELITSIARNKGLFASQGNRAVL